jgi:hypothetical protein
MSNAMIQYRKPDMFTGTEQLLLRIAAERLRSYACTPREHKDAQNDAGRRIQSLNRRGSK